MEVRVLFFLNRCCVVPHGRGMRYVVILQPDLADK